MTKNMYQKREERRAKRNNDSNEEISENKTNINWYPGHMAKTKREIKEKINLIDIVYEVIDARMPISSRIIDLDTIIKDKPRIMIITKYDLCDPIVTDNILNMYAKKYRLIKVDLKSADKSFNKKIINTTNELLTDLNAKRIAKGLTPRSYRALVIGAPNVGKSTLINRLAGKNVTQTGNRAGVTKNLNWIRINKDIEMLDTPGILWPKIERLETGYNLASLSSINEDILDKADISRYILVFLYKNYPNILKDRYGIELIDPEDLINTYEEIGRKRGALLKGNIVDLEKVYNIIINDLKDGKIKAVTLDIE